MNRVVEHGDGEEEGDGQALSQTKPSPVEPDHEKKVIPQTVKATSYYCTCKGRQPSPPQEGKACASPHL